MEISTRIFSLPMSAPAGATGPAPSPDTVSIDAAARAVLSRTEQTALSQHCLWRYKSEGEASFPESPVLAPDGGVVLSDSAGNVHEVDPLSGTRRWSHPTSASHGYAPEVSVGADGTVYAGTVEAEGGHISALAGGDGQERWSFPTAKGVSHPPVEAGDMVLVACRDGLLYAVDRRDGHEMWAYDARGNIHSPPWVDANGRVMVRTGSDLRNDRENHVYALDPQRGKKVDKLSIEEANPPDPRHRRALTPDGATIFLTRMDDNSIYACDPKTLAPRWSFNTGDEVFNTPMMSPEGVAYVVSGHEMSAVVEDTGAFLAKHAHEKTRDALAAAPTVLSGEPPRITDGNDHVVIAGVSVPKKRA